MINRVGKLNKFLSFLGISLILLIGINLHFRDIEHITSSIVYPTQAQTSGQIYYVSVTGSDSNSGIQSSPWRTIQYAANSVSAGDTIRVQPGTYAERVNLRVNGTAVNNTVTFVADGAATVCGFDFNNNHYIRVIGLTIDADAGGCMNSYGCVTVSGINTYLEFWNNTFRDAIYNGIRGGGRASATNYMSNSLIIGNTFFNFGVGNGGGVAIVFPSDHNLIAYNEVYNSHPDAFYMLASNTRWLNNYTHDLSEASGGHSDVFQNGANYFGWQNNLVEATFQIAAGNQGDEHTAIIQNEGSCSESCGAFGQNVIRRNVWHNISSGTWGIDRNDPGLRNIYYYNNTTAKAETSYPSSEASLYIYHGNITGTKIYNNLEYESWGSDRMSGIMVYYLDGGYDLDYNLAYDPNGNVSFSSPWISQTHAQSNINPYFINYNNDDFHLGSNSGAIDRAGPLTTSNGSGTGTTFQVATNGGGFFRGDDISLSQYDGNLVVGDVITVDTDTVRISSISGDSITVTSSFTWANGDPVYYGSSPSPDIGAYEYDVSGYNYNINISSPDNNSIVSGIVDIIAEIALSDKIRQVVFYIDNIPVNVDNTAPFVYSWNTTGLDNGSQHLIEARAYSLYASQELWKGDRITLTIGQNQTLTCSQQFGHICHINQICLGTWLTASDTTQCCSAICENPVSQPQISLTKQTDKINVELNGTITYILHYQNTSQVSAQNVKIIDNLPRGTIYILDSATQGGLYLSNPARVEWIITSLSAGAEGSLSFQVRTE